VIQAAGGGDTTQLQRNIAEVDLATVDPDVYLALEDRFGELLLQYTRSELWRAAVEIKVPLLPVNSLAEALGSEVHADRGFWQSQKVRAGGETLAPARFLPGGTGIHVKPPLSATIPAPSSTSTGFPPPKSRPYGASGSSDDPPSFPNRSARRNDRYIEGGCGVLTRNIHLSYSPARFGLDGDAVVSRFVGMGGGAPARAGGRRDRHVHTYAVRRLLINIPVVLLVATVVFIATSVLPGDFAAQQLPRRIAVQLDPGAAGGNLPRDPQ